MWKACIILLVGFYAQRLQAQNTYTLTGKVTDSVGAPLYPATVCLKAIPDTANTLTQENGSFSFANLKTRKIRLLISMKGYKAVDLAFAIPSAQRSVRLPTCILLMDYGVLDPVTVTRVRPVVIDGDTVSYNTAAFPVPDGSEVEDILKRLPGIAVDMDGNVIVQGKQIGKVLVDGKEFFGGDVLLAIRNLPADVIDKLQIVDDYGDQARLTGVKSGDPAKILNIVLKPDKRSGEFGRIETASGEQGKYADNSFMNGLKNERQISAIAGLSNNSPAGNDPAYKGGVNYANKWKNNLEGSLNGNIDGQSSRSISSSLQENYYSGEQLQQTQDNQNSSKDNNSSMNTQLIYKPDNHCIFRFTAFGSLSHSNNQVSSNFTTLQQDSGFTKSTTGQSQNNSRSASQSLNSSLYYDQLFPLSRRRFSVQINFNLNNSGQFSKSQSAATILTDSISSNSLLNYLVHNNAKNYSFSLNSTYFMPLGPTSFMEIGYREQSNISINNNQTQQPGSVNDPWIAVDSLSQDMLLHSFSENFHTGYTSQLHRFCFSASLDAQPGQLRGTVATKGDGTSFSYFSLIPSLQITWNLDKTRKFNLNYSRGPSLPNLQQLAPFTNLNNPQYPVTGNPNLKPAYTQNMYLHFEQSTLRPTQFFGYGLGVGYSLTQNSIIQNLIHPMDSSQVIQATTYLNSGTTSNLHADYHITLPAIFEKSLRITINGNLSQNQTISMTDSLQYVTQTWTWGQSLHLQLIIPNIVETDLQGNYSITHSTFPVSGSLPGTIKSAAIVLNCRHYFFKQWILSYRFSQSFISNGNKLQPAPTSLIAAIQRQFLPHKKGTIVFTGYNLLNQSAGVNESVSAAGFSQTKSVLTGRYFLISFQFKFNHFHN